MGNCLKKNVNVETKMPENVTLHLVHPNRCWNLLNRLEYIDRRTCPGMSWAGPFAPSKIAASRLNPF